MRTAVLECLIFMSIIVPPAIGQDEGKLPAPGDSTVQKTNESRASYGLGLQAGQNFSGSGLDEASFDFAAFVEGVRDGLNSAEPKVTQQDFQAAITKVHEAARARYIERSKPVAEKNLREGLAFMEKFKALDGVQALPSGVLYKVLKAAKGQSPKATDSVRVHYRGRFVDRKEFDSSYPSGQPAVFQVNEVVPGWTEALQRMKVGEKWQIVLPPKMGYGELGYPPQIGPQCVLIFDIELLGIEPQPKE